MEISISLLSPEERKYTYTQSQQLIQQLGCIGHLRADLGSGGQFFSNWNDHYASLDTKDFKQEFEQVMSALRLGPLYIDKHDRIIQDYDRISYDDGTVATIRIMKDGPKDCRITATEYHSSSQNVKEEYPPPTDVVGTGLRKLSNAELIDLDASESRENSAFCGAILESRDKLREFCLDNPSAVLGNTQEWGIRVNTQEYSYLMRLCPDSAVNNLFCYCYRRDWLDQHIQQARHGIRFISPMYEELFRIADGDQIRIICDNGENKDRTVRYIDDYHIELEGGFSSNIYHICEFAEMIERRGNSVIPLRSSLPEKCFVYVEASDQIGIVNRGESGYHVAGVAPKTNISKQESVKYLNDAMGISKAQAAAMSAGSLFGWATKAADPANYNDDGILQKKVKDRGDSR